MNARLMVFLLVTALASPNLAGCRARPATSDTTPATAAVPPAASTAIPPPAAAAPAPAAARPAASKEATPVPAASQEPKEPRRDGGGSPKAVVQRPAAGAPPAKPTSSDGWPQFRGPGGMGV